MKSRQTLQEAELAQASIFRLETLGTSFLSLLGIQPAEPSRLAEAPSTVLSTYILLGTDTASLEQLPSNLMSVSRGNGVLMEHLTPVKQLEHPHSPRTSSPRTSTYSREGQAKVIQDSIADGGSPRFVEKDFSNMQLLSPETPSSDTNETWSSAVGRATTAGKSGRVIERLMADNDKLRREVKLLSLKSEEVQRREDSIKSTLESLRATNQNLEAICDTNTTALDRRDRKIEILRVDLANEKARREKAEREQRDTLNSANQAISSSKRDLFKAQEISAHASSQYEVLRKSLKHVENEYYERVTLLSSEAQRLLGERRADQERFQILESLHRQLRTDQDRTTQAYKEILDLHDNYKISAEQMIRCFSEQAEAAEGQLEQLEEELITTMGQMRHVIGVKKHFKGEIRNKD